MKMAAGVTYANEMIDGRPVVNEASSHGAKRVWQVFCPLSFCDWSSQHETEVEAQAAELDHWAKRHAPAEHVRYRGGSEADV